MASPTGKKGLDKNLLIGLGALVLIAGAIFIFKTFTRDECPQKIEFTFSDGRFVDAEIQFNDLTDGATEWDWDFGDQSPHAYVRNPLHKYGGVGTFRVTLLLNGRCDAMKEIVIEPAVPTLNIIEVPDLPIATIVGPSECIVGERVHFSDASTVATSWDWMFNETGKIDAKTKEVDYTFKSPGTYKVVLIINGKSDQATHMIKVKPPKKEKDDGGGGGKKQEKPSMNSNLFVTTMQQIASRQKKFSVFEPYFCGDKNIKIRLPDNTEKGLNSYCIEVAMNQKFTGKSASFVTDPETGCITLIKMN